MLMMLFLVSVIYTAVVVFLPRGWELGSAPRWRRRLHLVLVAPVLVVLTALMILVTWTTAVNGYRQWLRNVRELSRDAAEMWRGR